LTIARHRPSQHKDAKSLSVDTDRRDERWVSAHF
jgi:hypothetical protein